MGVFLLLLLLTLGGPVATAPDAADACGLVPRAEAAAVLGGLRGDPKAGLGIQGEKECHYTSAEGHQLTLRLYGADRWELQKGIVSEMSPSDLSGLGDEAFSVKRGTDVEIYVRKGKRLLEIDSSAGSDAARTMAQKAIARVPASR